MTEFTVAVWEYLYNEGLIVNKHPHSDEKIRVVHNERSLAVQVIDDEIIIQEDLGHPRRICLSSIVWTYVVNDPESFTKMLEFIQEP